MNHNHIQVRKYDNYIWFGPPKVGPKHKLGYSFRPPNGMLKKFVTRYREALFPEQFRDGSFGAAFDGGVTVFSSRSIQRGYAKKSDD